MARHPVPGRVKSRLAVHLGPERACALYRAFVLDLAERLRTLPYEVTWVYEPATAPFHELVGGARCRAQTGSDLGERMAHAIAASMRDGATPVLVIGADVPHVPAASLAEAVAVLAGNVDLVLGPAEDGGYYLVGLSAPAPALFRKVPWGTARVLEVTLARAADAGLRTHLLPPTFDVDEVQDLERLAELLASGEVCLPRTAAELRAGAPRA